SRTVVAVSASSRSRLINPALHVTAAVALLAGFAIGGGLPLLNDYYLQPSYADTGFHPMAMGLLGAQDVPLLQRHGSGSSMYMLLHSYNDITVGVRVLEYAARKFGEQIGFATGPYWTYARHYYLDVVSRIPGDVISGAIGAFVNLMTLPH